MGLNPPVPQQDSSWEIRAAVLLSLFFQVLLIFLGPVRKRSSRPLYRLIVWSCYLLADWVADLALGLLLNNMGNIGGGDGAAATASCSSNSPIIFAFWTPFLLLHLGGPDTITAYSLEDNELWLRHLIGLLFELFSACVVFFCSLHGNPMIPATVLMFVVGIIKYAERTFSLYSGSVEGFRNKILDPPEPGPNYAKLMTEFDSKKKAGLVAEIEIADGEASRAHKEMEELETERLVLSTRKSVEARAYDFFLTFRRLFVNVILSFKERRQSQAFFLERKDMKASEAFEVIEVELNFIYDMVYTKAAVAHSWAGWVLRCICSGCLASALAIFFFLDKPGHKIQRVDVGITYALLLGGLALDAAALPMLIFSNRTKVYLEEQQSRTRWLWLGRVLRLMEADGWWQTRRWSGTVSQMNLIRYCQEKPGPYSNSNAKWWLMIVKTLGIEEIVDDFFFVRRFRISKRDNNKCSTWPRKFCIWLRKFCIKPLVPRCCDKSGVHDTAEESRLLDFIFDGLKGAAHDHKQDDKSKIMEVCSRRGNGVIDRLEMKIKGALTTVTGDAAAANNKFDLIIKESVTKKDFDESLLLWHIATDLCLDKVQIGPPTRDTPRFRAIAETLSEYMLYLLIKQPEMLAATAGIGLRPYRDTCAEARRFFASKEAEVQRFFGSMAAWKPDHDDARRMLLSVNTERKPAEVKGDRSKSVLFDAVMLAKALRELDEALMWELVTGVWGEMLSFAAVSGRWRTHVRSLNRGGELITLVWLLMQHLGLSDMYEIQEEDPRTRLIVHY